jgi:TolB-like protein/tetratricopeptide (TPR) repeat protein/tRNA A-37 threonylcarbamoyl transferase component Bud32
MEQLASALSDRYTIERVLGSGGMATVYLAEDLKHHRKVAVKVLRPELAAALGTDRFHREIEIAAQLTHPHILALHDSGEVDGFLYYVMPHVEGESLRERLNRETQLPIDDALHIAAQVAAALDYAHRHEVIHRDIKPENVMLHEGEAMVTDFGIAIAVTAAGGERLTETGLSLGTPAYMSPEQVAGAQVIDGRSDIYSLACVLYEMLAGDPPFTGATPQVVLARHVTDQVAPITTARSSVPAPLAGAISKALSKAPADRFDSAQAFSAALVGECVEPDAKSIAVLPFANLSADQENEYFSDGLAEDVIDALTQVPGLRVMARTSSFAFRGKEQDVRRIGAELNVAHILEGSVRRAGNRIRVTAQLVKASDGYHLWSQRFDREMTDIFAIQDEISQAIVEKMRVRLADDRPLVKRYTENLTAYDLCLKSRYHVLKMTQEGLDMGRQYCRQAIAVDPSYALAHAVLAATYWWSAYWGFMDPREAFPRAKSAALEALRLDDTIAEAHSVLGVVLGVAEFDWPGAEREFRRALELNPSSGDVRSDYALWFLRPQGRLEEALAEVQRALELDPLDVAYNSEMGYLLHATRQFERAVAQLQHAIDLDPTHWIPHWMLSITYSVNERLDDAIALAEKARELSGDHAYPLGLLGRAYALIGRTTEARQLLEELEGRRRSSYVPASSIAMIHRGLGNIETALEWYETALEGREPNIVVALKSEPSYGEFRRHPAYQTLLRKMNLEP